MSNLPAGAENDPNAPWNNEEENLCYFCGNPCDRLYCDDRCKKADLED